MSETTATIPATPSGRAGEEGFDLFLVIVPIWKGKWFVLLVATVSLGVSLYRSLQKKPIYHAEATLAPVDAGGSASAGIPPSLGGLAALAGIGGGSANSSNLTSALAIARSKTFAMQFIEKRGLMPKLNESIRNPKHPMDSLSLLDAAIILQGHVTVAMANGLVVLTVRWSDPETAAEWANWLSEYLNVYLRSKAISEADSSIDFLKGEILRTPVASMQEMLNRLIEKQIEAKTMAKVRTQYAFNIIDFAVPPGGRDSPNRNKDVIVGVALGLALSLSMIFGRIMLINLRKSLAGR